jgi:hypothetical protein
MVRFMFIVRCPGFEDAARSARRRPRALDSLGQIIKAGAAAGAEVAAVEAVEVRRRVRWS